MIEVLSDLAYLAVTAGLTFLVGRSLRAQGVDSLTTFHLAASAAIAFMYRWGEPADYKQATDYLSTKLAVILMVLGILNYLKRLDHAQQTRRPREVQS